MKKFFTLLLAVISTMTAFAQTEPAIELQAEVDGNTRTLTIGLGVEGTVQIDWGNGEKVTSEVIPAFDGWNQVNVSGTVSGEGKVKIYGDNIVYFECSSRVDGAQVLSLDVTKATTLKDLTANTNKLASMEIFGSYLKKERTLIGEAGSIVAVDTFVALMAGLIIIPACFSFGVEPGAGPGLIFLTLPNVFNQMTGGRIWGSLFFLFMSFAAFSTVIAVFENILSYAMDIWGWSRKKAVLVNVVLMIILSLPAVLGLGFSTSIRPR